MKKRMISSYTTREHKLTEKRNLFPDLAGAGGFYIPGNRQEDEVTEEEVTEMSDSAGDSGGDKEHSLCADL